MSRKDSDTRKTAKKPGEHPRKPPRDPVQGTPSSDDGDGKTPQSPETASVIVRPPTRPY